MKNSPVFRLSLAALFLALGLLLPFLTGNDRVLGAVLSLMHIPILLCGFVCGSFYGLAVGFLTPLLRSLLIGAPPMMPVALAMAFELAAYGALAGCLYRKLSKSPGGVYIALVLSMLLGRMVWGVASYLGFQAMGQPFTLQTFWTAAFITPWPGILLQLALVPAIVIALQRARLLPLKD